MSTDKPPEPGKLTTDNCVFMTLVEILVAVAILALGMMGILSLVPYAVRNTTSSLHKSVGGSVAKTVAVSLRNYSLDLSRVSDWTQGGLDGSGDLGEELYGNIATGFKIPEDLSNNNPPAAERTIPYQLKSDGSWKDTDYSWSAGIVDGRSEDHVNAQIAVWRTWDLIADEEELEIEFNSGDENADVTTSPDEFWESIDSGDYVRSWNEGIWYKVDSIDEDNTKIVLRSEAKSDVTGSAQAASRTKLVSLYVTTIP